MDLAAVDALLARIDAVLTEVPVELRFVRCSLCGTPLADDHRVERASARVTLWCWSSAAGERVGVDASGDERFAE